MEEFIEMLKTVKEKCGTIDCAECPLSVGIYQEGLDYTYYSCDIRKKPRDWDLEKERVKHTKASKMAAKKAEREKEKEEKAKKAAKREAKKKETKKTIKKKEETKVKKTTRKKKETK